MGSGFLLVTGTRGGTKVVAAGKVGLKLNLRGTRSRESARRLSGKLWPTGEFSIGVVVSRPDERLDERPALISLPGDEGTAADASGLGERRADRPLDLSNLPNSGKLASRPETYGRKGMTGYGKKMIKSVGALVTRDYPRHRVTFCTVTMPSVSDDMRVEMASAWPSFIDNLLRWVTRRLGKAGLPRVVCSVSEIQPRRLSDSGEGYLHLHLLWLNSPGKRDRWAIDVVNLRHWARRFWARRGVIGDCDHVNVDVKSVKGEVANYLAKYCSKGGSVIAEFAADNGWQSVPSQWWNMNKITRDWVKANVHSGLAVGELMASWLNYAWDWSDFALYRYIYQVEATIDGVLVNVGWRGCLVPEGLGMAVEMLGC